MNQPTFPAPPTHRSYVHSTCGEVTTVNGDEYLGLCSPMMLWLAVLPQRTMCVHCNKAAPLDQFAWEDTKETLAAYRSRLRGTMSPVKWVGVYVFRVLLILLGVTAGILVGHAASGVQLAIFLAFIGLCVGIFAAGLQMVMTVGDWRKYR
jgi:predicted nucleic acid-binding Zn ribbon protein